jgi:hypothetical protein
MSLFLPKWAQRIYDDEYNKGITSLFNLFGVQDEDDSFYSGPEFECMVSQLVGEYLEKKELKEAINIAVTIGVASIVTEQILKILGNVPKQMTKTNKSKKGGNKWHTTQKQDKNRQH